MTATKVRLYLARDDAGRNLFVPWLPFSNLAYVLPDPVARERIARGVERWFFFWMGAVSSALFAGLVADRSFLWLYAVMALMLGHWIWWTVRRTRGLERTRYQKPAS
jgi:hypothetical protein